MRFARRFSGLDNAFRILRPCLQEGLDSCYSRLWRLVVVVLLLNDLSCCLLLLFVVVFVSLRSLCIGLLHRFANGRRQMYLGLLGQDVICSSHLRIVLCLGLLLWPVLLDHLVGQLLRRPLLGGDQFAGRLVPFGHGSHCIVLVVALLVEGLGHHGHW